MRFSSFTIGIRAIALLALLIALPLQGEAEESKPPSYPHIEEVTRRLLSYFDRQLDNPEEYGKLAMRECRMFPEGDIFAFVFPALGYAHLAMADPSAKENSLRRIHSLIQLCVPSVVSQVQAPDRNLLKLKKCPPNATHLGQLNLILSYYRMLGGNDAPLLQLNDHLSNLLLTALEKSKGTPLPSYPHLTWPFDTAPCVLSLVCWGQEAERVAAVKSAHLQWLQTAGINASYKLPFAKNEGSRPRGCDLSLRLAILARLDAKLAKGFYQEYKRQFWTSRGIFSGFTEWPLGEPGSADIDSGPVFMEIGMAATGNGLAVARAMSDVEILQTYDALIATKDTVISVFERAKPGVIRDGFKSMGLTFNDRFVTGFLFGDAILFGVITWPMPSN